MIAAIFMCGICTFGAFICLAAGFTTDNPWSMWDWLALSAVFGSGAIGWLVSGG